MRIPEFFQPCVPEQIGLKKSKPVIETKLLEIFGVEKSRLFGTSISAKSPLFDLAKRKQLLDHLEKCNLVLNNPQYAESKEPLLTQTINILKSIFTKSLQGDEFFEDLAKDLHYLMSDGSAYHNDNFPHYAQNLWIALTRDLPVAGVNSRELPEDSWSELARYSPVAGVNSREPPEDSWSELARYSPEITNLLRSLTRRHVAKGDSPESLDSPKLNPQEQLIKEVIIELANDIASKQKQSGRPILVPRFNVEAVREYAQNNGRHFDELCTDSLINKMIDRILGT